MIRRRSLIHAAALAIATLSATLAQAMPVKVASAPATNLTLTLSAIRSAKTYLLINIYELASPEIGDAIAEQIGKGVHVELLLEGQPVGGVSAPAKALRSKLAAAMRRAGREDHLFVMSSKPVSAFGKPLRRYRYDHAKYVIVDGESVLIGSENYAPGGQPTQGTRGNRGWEVQVRDKDLADYYKHIFRVDADLSVGDVVDLIDQSQLDEGGEPAPAPVAVAAGEIPVYDADRVAPVVSPDTSQQALLRLIDGAQKSLDIEQMTFDSHWASQDERSPLLEAVVRAARRGVKVRVLLNDESVFGGDGDDSKSKNIPTVDALNALAESCSSCEVEGRIADVRSMGVTFIHNKGMLIDGRLTLVSSINWNQNSVNHNREAAVVLDSAQIHDHYAALFEQDWKASAGN